MIDARFGIIPICTKRLRRPRSYQARPRPDRHQTRLRLRTAMLRLS
jgi:hypothetical protein